MNRIVGVAELIVSADADDLIVTHSLGSCVGIGIYDDKNKVGGILHYMLPQSRIDADKARERPLMFGDLGIPMLFEQAYALGAQKGNLRVVIAGGANVIDDNNLFDIGRRNVVIARKLFWKNNVLIDAEDVGGNRPRTLRLQLSTGEFTLETAGTRTVF